MRLARFIAPSAAVSLALLAGSAFARLPPPSEAAQAQAAEAKAKAAWAAKQQAYLTCKAQNEAVQNYHENLRQAGKQPPAGAAGEACVDPGPYAQGGNERPPLEASEAHSRPEPANTPPSTPVPAGEQASAPQAAGGPSSAPAAPAEQGSAPAQ